MEGEKWIPCYETDAYEVSDSGQIRNAKTGRILKTHIDERGREKATIYVDGRRKQKYVHKIVAEAFYNEDLSDSDVFHRDGDKANNRIDNLLVGERSDSIHNAQSHGKYASTRQKGVTVVETGKSYKSIKECSEDIGVNQSTISKCLNYDFYGNRKGLHFEPAD